ncbi:MAG: galactonate dehydratase, partial [Halorhabdus sp.]
MKVTSYELYAVPPRWLFLKLETDTGLEGWGEPIVQGRLETVRTAVQELVEGYLIGADPRRVEHHNRTLYQGGYFRGGPVLMSAISGIDQALWDIVGRHHDCPVYELLGGHVRERVMVYGWVGGDTPARMASEANRLVERGYRAVKLNVPNSEVRPLETPERVETAVDHLAAVRDEIDDDVLVGVDFHGRVPKPMASRIVERLEPYDPAFIDQPVLPEHGPAISEVAERTSVPLSTGERLYTRAQFRDLLEQRAVSAIQPDVTHVGGITEMRKIATLADTYDVAVVPHCPLGPVAFAASLQVDFATHSAVLQEQDLDLDDPETSVGLRYLSDREVFEFVDGYVERPNGRGLGIDVDEEYVRERAQTDVNW